MRMSSVQRALYTSFEYIGSPLLIPTVFTCSRRRDLLGHFLEALKGTTDEEDPGPLAGEGPGECTTHLSSVHIDDGVLVLEQHSRSRCPSGC